MHQQSKQAAHRYVCPIERRNGFPHYLGPMFRGSVSWSWWAALLLLLAGGTPDAAASGQDSLRRVINQTQDPRTEFRTRATLVSLLLDESDLARATTEVRILQRQARRLSDADAQQLAKFYSLQLDCLAGDTAACRRFDSLATPRLLANPWFAPDIDLDGLAARLVNTTGRFVSTLRWGQLILDQTGSQHQYRNLRANALRNMAFAAHNLGLYDKSMDYIETARNIYKQLGDVVGLAATHHEIGFYYSSLPHPSTEQLHSAAAQFLRADELMAHDDKYLANRCYALLGAAHVYIQLKNYPRVATLLDQAQALLRQTHQPYDPILEFNFLQVQADLAKAQGEPAEPVIALGQRMVSLAGQTANPSFQQTARFNLAELLVHYQHWSEARPLLESLVADSQRTDLHLDALRLLSACCYALKDWATAADYYRRVSNLGDSLARSQSERLSRQLAEQYGSALKDVQIARQQAQLERRDWQIASIAFGLLFMVLLALALVRGSARLQRLNRNLSQRNDRISQQNTLLAEQHLKIEDSIRYASRIQHAILPEADWLAGRLPPHFIFYQPKDIVSGDFFWAAQQGHTLLLAAVDCTGHGVPGAFMSVVGYNLLNQIVVHEGLTEPARILHELDRRIAQTLHQQYRGENQDGMDVALLALLGPDPRRPQAIAFAGARRPLLVATTQGVTTLDGDRYSCGGAQHIRKTFTTHAIDLRHLQSLWMFSDGFTDQFGPYDEQRKRPRKLGLARLCDWLAELAHLPATEAGTELEHRFNEWMEGTPQLDDVLAIGLHLPAGSSQPGA